jgi:hypothetical protein
MLAGPQPTKIVDGGWREKKPAVAGILGRGRRVSPGMSAFSLIGTREHQAARYWVPSVSLAYNWRTASQVLSNPYPTPIRHLSDIYLTPIQHLVNMGRVRENHAYRLGAGHRGFRASKAARRTSNIEHPTSNSGESGRAAQSRVQTRHKRSKTRLEATWMPGGSAWPGVNWLFTWPCICCVHWS